MKHIIINIIFFIKNVCFIDIVFLKIYFCKKSKREYVHFYISTAAGRSVAVQCFVFIKALHQILW